MLNGMPSSKGNSWYCLWEIISSIHCSFWPNSFGSFPYHCSPSFQSRSLIFTNFSFRLNALKFFLIVASNLLRNFLHVSVVFLYFSTNLFGVFFHLLHHKHEHRSPLLALDIYILLVFLFLQTRMYLLNYLIKRFCNSILVPVAGRLNWSTFSSSNIVVTTETNC